MEFQGFTLDKFQEDAIHAIEENCSVVVSAATGTGKTLIADYIIDKYLKENCRVVYTAPIKALSNQKFKDFKNAYGEENVGILTGDIVVNAQAPILVMTTEIFRNMLLTRDPLIDEISYVIFDEIHYMNDPERGTVWEESIIFSPKHIRFLCLSATIPNAAEFASWLEEIKKHEVRVVSYSKRAVPLNHFVYEPRFGIGKVQDLKQFLNIPNYDDVRGKRRKNKGRRSKFSDYSVGTPYDIIKQMKDKLPAIVFSFSRRACEDESLKIIKNEDFADDESRKEIILIYRKHFTPEVNQMRTTAKLREALSKGVGFHHAGLLPQHKEAVEELFGKGLLKVLFATETFSVGINMPAKTVIFNGLRKFDGVNFRLINSKEYFQLAGRAGRRGIDKVGYVVSIIDPRAVDIDEFIRTSSADTDPILSQFKLSYNTVINLLALHSDSEIETILKSNFDYFMKKRKSNKQVRIMATFNNKKRILKKMGYIDENGLTDKGQFARFIYFEELLMTEIFTSELYTKLTDIEIIQLIAGIIYEPRQTDYFSFKGIEKQYSQLLRKIEKNPFVIKKLNRLSLKRMMALTGTWASGGRFKDLLSLTKLAEGDIIRLFRRIIDMIGQVKRASTDPDLRDKLSVCQQRIDRDLVAVDF